jgi:two-component system response regulator AtoC
MMSTENGKVLVVDDEEPIRNVLQRMLESSGYTVETAIDGQDALYKLALGDVGIVLLDIIMPNMSGTDVLKKLSNDINKYCILMITAVTDRQTAIDSLKMGAMDYITKPFDQEEVREKMTKAIEKHNRIIFEKKRYEQLQANVVGQTERMQEQFNELVSSLAREHKLLHQLAARQRDGGKEVLSGLPKELQEPSASVEEFRDALLRILKRK